MLANGCDGLAPLEESELKILTREVRLKRHVNRSPAESTEQL